VQVPRRPFPHNNEKEMRKTIFVRLALLCLLVSAALAAQNTPAENAIADARRAIADAPKQPQGYTRLAMALMRRARESGDSTFVTKASDAAKKALELEPNNLEAEEARVAAILARHDYPAALEGAMALNKRNADETAIYGLLTDANRELGNYPAAEDAAQWMLNLRPGNLPAYIRAAELRELFGDFEGSYELMDLAFQSTPVSETEERAWLASQMGHLKLAEGDAEAAGKLLDRALTAFPNYHIALAGMAQVRIAQKRYDDAVVLLQKLSEAAPRAKSLYALANALEMAGQDAAARKAFAEFEAKALLESGDRDNANRELVLYYAGNGKQPAKALEVAKREFAWRHDVYTLDAYAWALHVNGQDAEARKQMAVALAVGTRDAAILRHAAELGVKPGDHPAGDRGSPR